MSCSGTCRRPVTLFAARPWRAIALILVALLAPSASPGQEPADPPTFAGVLSPASTALVKSMHDERVAEVPVRVGDRVREGDLLIRLEDAQERVEMERARAWMERQRGLCERTRRLHAEHSVSDDALDVAETDLAIAEKDFELARIRLEERSIRAPFDGIVAERFVDPGASVENGDRLLRVTALSPVRVEVLLPEKMVGRLREPFAIDVALASPARTLRVDVEPRPLVVDPASGTFLLQVEIPNDDGSLVPGVSCRVSLAGAAAVP